MSVEFKHSLLGGVGILLAIPGLFGVLIAAAANNPPEFVLPLSLAALGYGVYLAARHIPKARRLRQGRPPRLAARSWSQTRAYPATGEPIYPYSLDNLPPDLEPLADQVRALARPCVSLAAELLFTPLPPTASKLGGIPYRPAERAWPACPSGRPMTFVGQLNFAQLAAALAAAKQSPPPEMPTQGILSFFYNMESMPSAQEGAGGDDCRFFWDPRPDEALAVSDPPEQAEALAECRLTPSVRPCLPSPGDEAYPFPPELPQAAREAFNELQTRILPTPVHQVLGHPAILQGDPRLEAARPHPGQAPSTWRLLWQIDTDDSAGIMWGDAGILYILIRTDDLKALCFDRLFFEWQCY